MSSTAEMRQLASEVREVAREEALRASPPLARYRVVRKKPFTVEAFGSDDRLTAGDEGFEVAPTLIKRAKVGDTVMVATDEFGDKVAVSLALPSPETEEPEEEGAAEELFAGDGLVRKGDTISVAPLGITDEMLAGGIDLAKLAVDPLNRANHTGTQTAATISDFSAAAQAENVAGDGLTRTGTTLAVGAGTGIAVGADTVGIAPEGVGTGQLANLGVTAAKLAAESVETGKLANLAVTTGKLAALAVNAEKLAAGAVTTEKLGVGAVTTEKIAASAVTTTQIADGTIREADLAAPVFINIKDPAYGAVGNNVADDTAAIDKAIAALPVAGGTIFFPRGAYKYTGHLNLEGRRSVRFIGSGAMSAGSTPGSLIVFTAGGAEALINAKQTSGFNWADLTLWATSEVFTGAAVDLTESAYFTWERGNFAHIGMEGKSEALTFKLKNAQIGRFRDLTFGSWHHSFHGQFEAADFSNVILFQQCKFQGGTQAPFRNPGANWTLQNCTFQPLAGGNKAGALFVEAGIEAVATTIINCGCYDAAVEGEWFNWRGQGLVVLGGLWGNGTVGIRARGKGISIDGVWMQGPTNGIVVEEGEDVQIGAGNYFTGVKEKVVVNGVGRSDMLFADKRIESADEIIATKAVVSKSGGVWANGAAVGSFAFLAGVTGDAFSRLAITADGKLAWGSGLAVQDVTLYRAAENVLATDDQFRILGASGGVAFLLRKAADAAARLRISETGVVELGDGTEVGLDTNFYRAAANVLATDDQLRILGSSGGVALVQRKSTDESARFRLTELGVLEFGDGTPTGLDTNLYRAAANSLKTDDSLTVAGAKTLIQPSVADGTEVFRVNNKAGSAHLTIDTEGGIVKLGRRASIAASSVNTMLAVNQEGAGIVADFQVAGTSLMKLEPGPKIGVFNTAPAAKQKVEGSRGGNAALASLLTALANYGWITNSTVA